MVEASCQPRVEIVERLAATIDCKQKSVRAVRFNGMFHFQGTNLAQA